MMHFLGKGLGSKISTILAIAIWVMSMFFVYKKNYATTKPADFLETRSFKTITGEIQNWMTVTMNNTKIGYNMQSLTNTPLGYLMKEYSLIRIPLGGTQREIYVDSYSVLNPDFSLKTLTFGLVSGDYTTDIYGEVSGEKLHIKIKSQNSESSASFDAHKGIYLPGAVPIITSSQGFPTGEFSLPTFDPLSMATSDIQITVGAKEETQTELGKLSGHRLTLNLSGIESHMWVDDKGQILREEDAGGMLMSAAAKESALDMPGIESKSNDDILNSLAVHCQGKISDPRNAQYLKVRIDGIDPALFDLKDDFQTVISTNPLILEIHPGKIDSSALTDSQKFLKAEPFLQTDDPAIIQTANKIVGNEINANSKAVKIENWVFNNVEKDYTVSLPSAIDVLKVRKGDCNEHTALYTALARAAGLPTKMCIGIVYKDGLFYYHAWPAVYLGGWTPIDPTFGQKIADATHIKLLEGGLQRQADLMKAVGKISVTVIEDSSSKRL